MDEIGKNWNDFQELKVEIDEFSKTVWLYLDPKPCPCFTLRLLSEISTFRHIAISNNGKLPHEGDELVDINYVVVASKKSVFNFGGDLNYFISCIEQNNYDSLRAYAKSCIDAIYYHSIGYGLGWTSISLIEGDALGGGLEAALSSHVIFAKENAKMGFPEVLFNLFPGMGAYHFLLRRTNSFQAEKILKSGIQYSANDFHQMGLVDFVFSKEDGIDIVKEFICNDQKKRTNIFIRQIANIANPVNYEQIIAVGDLWAESAIRVSSRDLKIMQRLSNRQMKEYGKVSE